MRDLRLAALALLLPALGMAQGLIGSWTGGGHAVEFRADGTLTFDGQDFRYQAMGSLLWVQGPEGVETYQVALPGKDQLVVQGGELGRLVMARAAVPGAGAAARTGVGRALEPAAGSGPGAPQSGALPPEVPDGLAAVAGAPSEAAPPEVASARAPGDGKPVTFREYGFTFTPGAGWKGGVKGDVLLVGHDSIPGMVLIQPTEETITPADLQASAREGYRAAGVTLTPTKPGTSFPVETGMGTGLYFGVTGTLGKDAVKGYLAGFVGPTGQAVIVFAGVTPEKWAQLEPHAKRMIRSVRLSKADSPVVRDWTWKLSGKRLFYWWNYYSSSGGGGYGSSESKKYWHLCPDGTYWYTSSSHTHIDTGTGAGSPPGWGLASGSGRGQEQGTWRIVPDPSAGGGAALVLTDTAGGVARYPLSMRKKGAYTNKYLGDMRVFTDQAADCR